MFIVNYCNMAAQFFNFCQDMTGEENGDTMIDIQVY